MVIFIFLICFHWFVWKWLSHIEMCQLSLWSMTCKWSVKFSMIFFSLHPRSLNVPASFYFTSTRWYYQKLTTNFKVVDHISTFENNKNTKWSSSMSWIQFNQIWKTIEALSMKSRRRKNAHRCQYQWCWIKGIELLQSFDDMQTIRVWKANGKKKLNS